jgi:hypothetical protein
MNLLLDQSLISIEIQQVWCSINNSLSRFKNEEEMVLRGLLMGIGMLNKLNLNFEEYNEFARSHGFARSHSDSCKALRN